MTKPTIEELTDAFFEKLQNIEQARHEAEGFFNYYSSVGWVVGKKPMKAWRFAVLNWLRRMNKFKPQNANNGKSRSDIENFW